MTVIFRTISSWHKVQHFVYPFMEVVVLYMCSPLMYLCFPKMRELLAQVSGVFL